VDGRVQKKNNWTAARDDYYARYQAEILIDRRAPGEGFRHILTVGHVREAISLLPVWNEVAVGLDAIVIDAGDRTAMGWYRQGIVALCAWDVDLWWPATPRSWVEANRRQLEMLGVEQAKRGKNIELRWTLEQARAFMLLDVLPHELGHHHDLMTSRRQVTVGRGEPYAERYAARVMDEVFDAYVDRFGI
jgi:hypothetical protein